MSLPVFCIQVRVVSMGKMRQKFEKHHELKGGRTWAMSQVEFLGFAQDSGIPRDDASILWQRVDADGNGTISFEEFRTWVEELTSPDAHIKLAKLEAEELARAGITQESA